MTGDQAADRARIKLAHHLSILYQASGLKGWDRADFDDITELILRAAVDRAVALCREPGEYRVFTARGEYVAATAAVHRLRFIAESLAESGDVGHFPVEFRGQTCGKIEVRIDGTWELAGDKLKAAITRALGPGPRSDR